MIHLRCCVVLVPLFLAGCVEGYVGNFVKYDKDADAFHLLQYYTNLHATEPKDLDHLAALWKKKNAIILSPVDADIFATYGLEKIGKHEYRALSLGEPDKKPAAQKTKADLDAVKIIPGEFFLNRHGNLAAYHQCIVPGKVVDALLDDYRPDIFAAVAQEAEKQIEISKKTDKVRKLTWEDLGKELVRDIIKGSPREPREQGVEDLYPLEPASLKMLLKAGTEGTAKLTRRGDAFTIFVPVTAKDAKELLALATLARVTATAQIKAGQKVEEGVPELLEALQVQAVDGGIALTVHAAKFFHAFTLELDPAPDGSKQKGYQTTVAGAQSRGIILSNDEGLKKLAKEYGVRLKK